MNILPVLIIFLSILGIADAGFITYEEFIGATPACEIGSFFDCGAVLNSPWSKIGPIPLAVLGLGYYCTMFLLGSGWLTLPKYQPLLQKVMLLLSSFGALFSLFLMYLQLGVIRAICLYCTISAIVSILLFFSNLALTWQSRKQAATQTSERTAKEQA